MKLRNAKVILINYVTKPVLKKVKKTGNNKESYIHPNFFLALSSHCPYSKFLEHSPSPCSSFPCVIAPFVVELTFSGVTAPLSLL
jgi:hypothetical protein